MTISMQRFDEVPVRLSREQYEALAADTDALQPVPVLSDAEIQRRAYAVRYGQWSTYVDQISYALAYRRLLGIEAERQARQQPAPAPVLAHCAACGVASGSLLSSSAHGAVCPDCYDTLEAEV